MNIKRLVVEFLIVFAVALVASVGVGAAWNLIVHGSPTIDWETSFRFGILFGIIMPVMEARRTRRS